MLFAVFTCEVVVGEAKLWENDPDFGEFGSDPKRVSELRTREIMLPLLVNALVGVSG